MRFWASAVLVVVLDQISKGAVMSSFTLGESRPLIDGVLWLTYVRNSGAAFSIMEGKTWFFLIAAGLVIAGLAIYNKHCPQIAAVQILLGMLAGGAAGNFIDRLRFQAVIDFIDLGWWPVFNIADTFLVCAGILLVLYLLSGKGEIKSG